jgi:zinc protease
MRLPTRPEQIVSKPITLTVPKTTETTLGNGMRLFTYESRDLASVNFIVLIKAGKLLEPSDRVGLAEVTARALRSGGTSSRTGDQLDRELEQIGSELGISVEREFVKFELFALLDQRAKALGILADLLQNPVFEDRKLQQEKDLALERIRRENDNPGETSRREFRKVVYGPDHPLARTPTAKGVDLISRDDVRAFYERYYRPASTWFGVAGNAGHEEAENSVQAVFASWLKPSAEIPAGPLVDDAADTSSGVFLVQKNSAQSQFRIGHLGMVRHAPEQYAVDVLNGVYGTGGFSSRLVQNVRTRRGFAYSVGGGVFDDDPRGLFVAAGSSKAKSTIGALREVVAVTTGILAIPPTDPEIETAKLDAIYSFATKFDVSREIVYHRMYYGMLGYPDDYLDTYVDRIRAVTRDEVRAAAAKLIRPDRLKFFVIGNQPDFEGALSAFGEVRSWNLAVEVPAKEEAAP